MKFSEEDKEKFLIALDLFEKGALKVEFDFVDPPVILTRKDYYREVEEVPSIIGIGVITPEQVYNDQKYASLKEPIKRFLEIYPFEKNVFIMMRYYDNVDIFKNIEKDIKDSLIKIGLVGHLARDRTYVRNLYDNIKVYMACCQFGIAVFEEIKDANFNPNISIELGFMEAWGREVLLLKEEKLNRLHTDIVGELYEVFNQDRVKTIRNPIKKWVMDLPKA